MEKGRPPRPPLRCPESVVTFVAVAFSRPTPRPKDLGVGAAHRRPACAAHPRLCPVVGLTLLGLPRGRGRGGLDWPPARSIAGLSRDQAWFLAIFAAKIGLGLVAFAFKPWLGLLFLGAYARSPAPPAGDGPHGGFSRTRAQRRRAASR